MPVNRAAQSSPFEHPTSRSYRHWTSEEDASLFAAVKQYGQDWTLVKAVLEQDGFTPRPRPCFPARWRTLEERAARQKWDVQRTEAAADASTSSTAIANDASGSLGEDAGEQGGEGGQGKDDPTSAYEVAGQTHSSSATLPVTQPKRGRGRPRKHPLPAQGATSSSKDANNPAAANQSGTATASRSPQSSSLASRSTRALDTPTPSSPQDAERGRAPAGGVAAAVGASAPTFNSETPSWSLNSRAFTYSTDLQPNGCVITDLPPGFRVYIVSPTRCQVVVPAQRAAQRALAAAQGQQQQCPAPADAPFAFEVKMDGSIEVLNLPEGTTYSKKVVEAENSEVRVQEGYHGVSGYTVLFEYRCEVGGGSSDKGSAGERGE